jgi:hypothetical protein
VSKDVLDALILAALFEASDRARLQVYRALDQLEAGDRKIVAELRMNIFARLRSTKPASTSRGSVSGSDSSTGQCKRICPEVGTTAEP